MNAATTFIAAVAGALGAWLVSAVVSRYSKPTHRIEQPAAIALTAATLAGLSMRFEVPGRQFVVYGLLTLLIVGLALLDIRSQTIPNVITIPGTIVGIAASNWILPRGIRDSLLGAALGGGILLLATAVEALRKKEIGGGDWKYAAMLGSSLGAQRIVFALLFSGVIGLIGGLVLLAVSKGAAKPRALGPWLSAGALMSLLWK